MGLFANIFKPNGPRLLFISESRRINKTPAADKELRRILYSFTNENYEKNFITAGFPKDDGTRKYLPHECDDKMAFHIDRFYETAGTCRRWIREATSPSVFFKYLSEYRETLKCLQRLEPYNDFYAPTPTQQLRELENSLDKIQIDFFERSWNAVLLAAQKAKTQETRQKHIDGFFADVDKHRSELTIGAKKKLAHYKILPTDNAVEKATKTEKVLAFDSVKERELLAVYRVEKTAMKRHFARISLIDFYYKYRKDPSYFERCMDYCMEDIIELDAIDREAIAQAQKEYRMRVENYGKKEADKMLPLGMKGFIGRITAFDRLSMLYKSRGMIDEAISCCKTGIERYTKLNSSADEIEKLSKRIDQLKRLRKD